MSDRHVPLPDTSFTRRALLGRGAALALAAGTVGGCRSGSRGRVRLDVWSMWSGDEEEAFVRVLKRYEALNPHLEIGNLGSIRDDTKTIRAIVAGVPPDVFTISDPLMLGPLAAQGAVLDLEDRFRQAGLRDADFVPGALSQCRFGGRLHAMPYLLDCFALMWSKKAFAKAGLDPEKPPATIEELDAYARKLTTRDAAGGLTQLGLAPLSNRSFFAGDMTVLFHLFGGRLYDAAARRVTPDAPENVQAMEWYTKLIDAVGGYGKVNAYAAGFGQAQGGNNPFFMGKIAMMINGQWNPYWAETYAPGLEYGVAPLPAPSWRPDRARTTWLGGNLFCIPRGGKHPEESWRLLAWMQTEEAQVLFADAMHGVPNVKRVLANRSLRTGDPWRVQFGKYMDLAPSPTAGHFPVLPVASLYSSSLTDAVDFIMEGTKPIRRALADVRVRVQRELDRYG